VLKLPQKGIKGERRKIKNMNQFEILSINRNGIRKLPV
jgi:hypothetical protein